MSINKLSIAGAIEIIDRLAGQPGDDGALEQCLIELLRAESLHGVADSVEAFRRRREINYQRMIDRVMREIEELDEKPTRENGKC